MFFARSLTYNVYTYILMHMFFVSSVYRVEQSAWVTLVSTPDAWRSGLLSRALRQHPSEFLPPGWSDHRENTSCASQLAVHRTQACQYVEGLSNHHSAPALRTMRRTTGTLTSWQASAVGLACQDWRAPAQYSLVHSKASKTTSSFLDFSHRVWVVCPSKLTSGKISNS